jgi:rubrerythrin
MNETLLLITNYDEWYGPIYTCPFCAEETVMNDFNFCPNCGADMDGFKFESISDEQKRKGKKENE